MRSEDEPEWSVQRSVITRLEDWILDALLFPRTSSLGGLSLAFGASAFWFCASWGFAQRLPAGVWTAARSLLCTIYARTRANACDLRVPLETPLLCSLLRVADESSWFRVAPCPSVGLMWTMKLWDSVATCLILLSAVCASPLLGSRQQRTSTHRGVRAAESPLELPPVQIRLSVTSQGISRAEADTAAWDETLSGGETCKRRCWGSKVSKTPVCSVWIVFSSSVN